MGIGYNRRVVTKRNDGDPSIYFNEIRNNEPYDSRRLNSVESANPLPGIPNGIGPLHQWSREQKWGFLDGDSDQHHQLGLDMWNERQKFNHQQYIGPRHPKYMRGVEFD